VGRKRQAEIHDQPGFFGLLQAVVKEAHRNAKGQGLQVTQAEIIEAKQFIKYLQVGDGAEHHGRHK